MRKTLFLFSLVLFIGGFFCFAQQASAAISFTISNPTILNDEIEVDASITGLTTSSCSSSGCYLQAQLRILDESKSYFGFTRNSEEYIDYFTPASIDEVTTRLFNFVPTSGSWSGRLKAKNNPEDSNYTGPGQYAFKFRRFTGNSKSSASESNVLTLTFSSMQITPTPSPTSPIPMSTSITSSSVSPSPTTSSFVKPSSMLTQAASKSASIAGVAKLPKLLPTSSRRESGPTQEVLGSEVDMLSVYAIIAGVTLLLIALFILFKERIRSLLHF